MAKLGERKQQLHDHGLNETALSFFTAPDEAQECMWRNDHELAKQIEWAKQRHAFILEEIRQTHPTAFTKKAKQKVDGPPIVSHRGRNGRQMSVYGESKA